MSACRRIAVAFTYAKTRAPGWSFSSATAAGVSNAFSRAPGPARWTTTVRARGGPWLTSRMTRHDRTFRALVAKRRRARTIDSGSSATVTRSPTRALNVTAKVGPPGTSIRGDGLDWNTP